MFQTIIFFIIRSLGGDSFTAFHVDFLQIKPTQIVLPGFYLYMLVFVVTFFASQWLIPQAIRFAFRFELVDHPNSRKKHLKATPILGGISIFISVIFIFFIAVLFLYNYPEIDLNFKLIFGLFSAVALMVFFGLKDDIIEVNPLEKVVFQIVTAFFVIVSCGVRIENFDGLFGIYELPTLFSYLFSVFVFVIVVNSFNSYR